MPEHTIEAGETLSSIAASHGLPSEKAILEAEENREYLEKRPDPHTLQPGETVFVPEKGGEPQGIRTGAVSRMVVELKRLRVVLLDTNGKPLVGAEAHIEIEGNDPMDVTTDDAGKIDVPVRGHPQSGTIEVADQSWELAVSHLPPLIDTPNVEGTQKRLHNLGYAIGEIDGKAGPLTRAALRAFQREHRLAVHGRLDDTTLNALQNRHGQ
ncbi:MAG: peptidoglycan-binding protein [Planctomycetota bacterium]